MDNYNSKYIKYKDKYLKLKNKPDMLGGGNITHINCTTRENNDIFLTLLLQLLIEYELMFDLIQKDNDSKKFLRNKQFLTRWPNSNHGPDFLQEPKPWVKSHQEPSPWAKSKQEPLHDQHISPNTILDNKPNNSFLSIFNFYTYNKNQIHALLNSKEQINDTIKLISNYCLPEIRDRCKEYREELVCNKDIIQQKCLEDLLETKNSFYDSRNYSITLMFNTLLGTYDYDEQPPTLVYSINKNSIIDGHIFILNHHIEGCLEAISIQSSLKMLISNTCYNEKTGISTQIFAYVFSNVIPLFKSAHYIYAYAWKQMSEILVSKYCFNTFTFNRKFQPETFYINNKDINSEKINVNSIEYALFRDLKDNATSNNDIYIFTVRKI